MTTVAPKWDELVPLPIIFDPKARITLLQSILIPGNPHYQHPRQHPNIRAAIALYESGKLDGSKVFISGGRVVSNEEALEAGLPVWSEVSAKSSLSLKYVLTGNLGRLLSSIHTKGHIPLQPANERASLSLKCVLTGNLGRLLSSIHTKGHIPLQPANERAFRILRRMQVLWDTGSNVLSIFDHDLLALAGNQETIDRYLLRGIANILSADGVFSVFLTYWVEYRFCDPTTGAAWSAWMWEEAIVRPLTPGACRLSGVSMGHNYYFGTGPTTPDLSVASTKGGMSSQLN